MAKCVILCLCLIICAPSSDSFKIIKKIKELLHPTTSTTTLPPQLFVPEYEKESDEKDSDEDRITTSTKSSRDSSEEFFSAENGETFSNTKNYTVNSPTQIGNTFPEISTTEKSTIAHDDYGNVHDNNATSTSYTGSVRKETKHSASSNECDPYSLHLPKRPETTNDFDVQTSTAANSDSYYSGIQPRPSQSTADQHYQTSQTTTISYEDVNQNQIEEGGHSYNNTSSYIENQTFTSIKNDTSLNPHQPNQDASNINSFNYETSSTTQSSNSESFYDQVHPTNESNVYSNNEEPTPTQSESSYNEIEQTYPPHIDVGNSDNETQGNSPPVNHTSSFSNQNPGSESTTSSDFATHHIIFPDNPALNATEEPLRIWNKLPTKIHEDVQFTTERSPKSISSVKVDDGNGRNLIDGPTKDCGPGMKPDEEGICRREVRK